MSDRDRFIAAARPRWKELEELLTTRMVDGAQYSRLSVLYRAVATDLSHARAADFPTDVLDYLDELAGRAHNALYGGRRRGGSQLARLIFEDVPREVRSQAAFFWAATFLFLAPALVAGVGAFISEDVALAVMPKGQLKQMEAMYSDAIGRGNAGEDANMAGFYIYNNVGIAFRCFATGALAGLGSVFFLVFNGAVIGTVFGHLAREGHGWNLLGFTSGHSAWELIGIVMAGAAGLRLGWAMIDTGGLTVTGSLRQVAPVLYRLVAGAAFMLFVAAAIEGFWSAGPVPFEGKLVFGAVQFGIVVAWLSLGGRSPEQAPRVGDG